MIYKPPLYPRIAGHAWQSPPTEVIAVRTVSVTSADGLAVRIEYELDDGARKSLTQLAAATPLPRPGQPALVVFREGQAPLIQSLPFSPRSIAC